MNKVSTAHLLTLDNLKSTNKEELMSIRFTLMLSLFCLLSAV